MKKLLPLLLLLAACSENPTASGAELAFDVARQEGSRAVLTPRFEPAAGGLHVSGTMSTSCFNQQPEGELEAGGRFIVLRVRAVLPGDACLTMAGHWEYTARVTGLAEGVYQVRVLYHGVEPEPVEAGAAWVRVE